MATGSQAHSQHLLNKAKLAPPSARRRRSSELKVKKSFPCLECSKTFNSLEKLKVHSYSHTGERPYHCSHPGCTKAFVSKYKLLRHVATHSPEKHHKCSFCEKMFHRKDHLKNHLHTHDPHKEAFTCQECGKSYNTKLGFKRHLALHSAHSGDLTCQVCLQHFPSTAALLDHLRSHSGKSSSATKEKRHCCEHCERRFYTRKDVRRHMVVHTGRKDFLCQYCAQRFGRKDHLTRHVKKSHGRELPRVKTEPADVLEPIVFDLASTSIKGELMHQHSAYPGAPEDPVHFSHLLPPKCLTSYPQHKEAALETYLMELQSAMPCTSASAASPSSKADLLPLVGLLEDVNEDESSSKISPLVAPGCACDSSSSSLMDFSQLFSFLPCGQVGGGSSAPELAPQPCGENFLQGLGPTLITPLSSPTTLPRFHQAFQ